jgi:hypothetical protein
MIGAIFLLSKSKKNSDIIAANFPLMKGDSGEYVQKLQIYLNTQGAGLTVDGLFGSQTEAALLSIMGKTEVDYNTFKNQIVS